MNKSQVTIYVFGNQDDSGDRVSLQVAERLKLTYPNINFIVVKPNQDLPFDNREDVILMDVVEGLTQPELIQDSQTQKIFRTPRSTVHDFDLNFQLAYLKKIGRLGKITIIGLPMNSKINYSRIHSIFKKLVAQDMQGS